MRALARVLLVEDDASLRRFVAMALEELPIALTACAGVGEALQALGEAPARLVITDLMMPGEPGLSLVQRLHDDAGLRAGAHVAVFSAGIDAPLRRRLEELGVWRILRKPASVADLEACVRDGALGSPAAPAAPAAAGRRLVADPVHTHFGGNAVLFEAFRASCLGQFPHDLAEGDDAFAQRDAARLRRLAHSLKSVMAMLGRDDDSALARQLESQAAAHDWAGCAQTWPTLRDRLSPHAGSAPH